MQHKQNMIIDPLKQEQEQSASLKFTNRLEDMNGLALSGEFVFLYGSGFWANFADRVMQWQGAHLFTTALILNVIRLGLRSYHYFFGTKNTNAVAKTDLLYNAVQIASRATAILGALVAATTFVLITPIIFTVSVGLDLLRNLGTFLWNGIRWGMLAFQTRGKNLENPLIKAKYEHLSSIYRTNVKEHAVGTGINLLLLAGTIAVFLLPHVSAAGAAIAATTVPLFFGLKTTIAGAWGALAGLAIAAGVVHEFKLIQVSRDYVVKPVINVIKKAGSALFGAIKKMFANDESLSEENKPLINKSSAEIINRVEPIAKQKVQFRNMDDIHASLAEAEQLNHKAFLNQSQYRDVIMNHIPNEEKSFAKDVLSKMVRGKIELLRDDLGKGIFLTQAYQDKARLAKIKALDLVVKYLDRVPGNKAEKLKDEYGNTIKTVEGLVSYIIRTIPEVGISQFLNESDTKNVLRAVVAYGRFEKLPREEERYEIKI